MHYFTQCLGGVDALSLYHFVLYRVFRFLLRYATAKTSRILLSGTSSFSLLDGFAHVWCEFGFSCSGFAVDVLRRVVRRCFRGHQDAQFPETSVVDYTGTESVTHYVDGCPEAIPESNF